jgi:hypothetical protein
MSNYSKVMPVSEAGGPHMINGYQESDYQSNKPDSDGDYDNSQPGESELTEDQMQELAAAAAELKQRKEDMFAALASDVEAKLTKRMGTRKAKENQWLEAMRIYLGSLSSYNIVTGDYPFGTSDGAYSSSSDQSAVHRPEFNIIRQKCNVAIAQTISYQFAAGDKNWSLRTPPVLDLDEHDMQLMAQQAGGQQLTPQEAADMKTDLMEREIENHLNLTCYPSETRKALADRVILGTGVLKGPLNCGKLKRIYVKQQTSAGKIIRVPQYTVETTPLVYRVNIWYWFPDDSVTDVEKAEDAIEVHPMNKSELKELMQHPGYMADQIAPCLEEEPRAYVTSPFNDPAYLTQGINLLKNKYLVSEYHGPIKKADLDLLGIEHDDSPLDEVYGEIWVCNSRVIRLQLSTIEGCYKLPYAACVWEPDPATIYGFGIPMLARDQQRVVNETYKMVLDNAGVSAGPQVVVDSTIIAPAEGGNEVTPWKVWLSKEYGADMTKAIQFFTPPNSFEQLSALMTMARGFADEESSINLITAGEQPSGAMDSATGLALANQNALTPLFFKSEEWDDHITRRIIEDMYDWEMQYNEKEEIKGTFDIDVRTSTAFLKGLMDQQKLDRLFQEIAQGSPVAEWINLDALTQARLTTMKLPSADIVKTPQQVAAERQQKAQQPPQPDPNMLKAQAMMQQVEVDKQKLQVQQNQLQWDQQKHAMDQQFQAAVQHDTNVSKEKQHQLDFEKAALQIHGENQDRQVGLHAIGMQSNAQLQSAIVSETTKKQIAGLRHSEHVQKLQVDQQKIAAEVHKSHTDQENKLHVARVNAATKTREGRQETPNRKLGSDNPKP